MSDCGRGRCAGLGSQIYTYIDPKFNLLLDDYLTTAKDLCILRVYPSFNLVPRSNRLVVKGLGMRLTELDDAQICFAHQDLWKILLKLFPFMYL